METVATAIPAHTREELLSDDSNTHACRVLEDVDCLYVDLDETLVAIDTFHEALINSAHRNPLVLLSVPRWLLHGPAFAKRQAALYGGLDVASLPYRTPVLDIIRQARTDGKRVVLATGADRTVADQVGQYLGLFDAILASDGETNLVGARKLEAIDADRAGRSFCYVANSRQDIVIWRDAAAAVVVSGTTRLVALARALPIPVAEICSPRTGLTTWLTALRCSQWAKNLLVFLPLLPVAKSASGLMIVHAFSTFIVFCLAASATYLFNDLLDLRTDREHPRKRVRALAAGDISALAAAVTAAALFSAAVLLAMLFLLPLVGVSISLYVFATTAYSLWLKERPLVDVGMLTALYSLRILAGAAAIELMPSPWMLAFSMFLFFSLALGKRYTEIVMSKDAGLQAFSRRGYHVEDVPLILITGICASQLSVLTLALYWNDPATQLRFSQPAVGWLLCPLLLFWLCRFWFKAHRRQLEDDPVAFVLRDRATPALILFGAFVIYWAL